MQKYLVRKNPSPDNPKHHRLRDRWKRSIIELNGRFSRKYRHELSGLLMQSYSEIGSFSHLYHAGERPCHTHRDLLSDGAILDGQGPVRKPGISALDFDDKGIYLASVTRAGCLTVHDFETLYCQSSEGLPCLEDNESKHVVHLSLPQQLDVVRWNLANQDEVACATLKTGGLRIFDIGYISSEPVVLLRTRRAVTVVGSDAYRGLSDIAFTATDKSRLLKVLYSDWSWRLRWNLAFSPSTSLVSCSYIGIWIACLQNPRVIASDTHGVINVWDRRASVLPCLELTTFSKSPLNSVQLHAENEVIFAAGKHGNIYMWDLRGGRTSAAFQSHNKEHCHPPLASTKLASMLEKIGSLKAQSNIVPQDIHSISLDPSCPYQLAFHLDNGWSGVLDIYNFQVTHVHCPPPAWLNGSANSADLLQLRKPSWLPTNSIYVAGSSSENGIYLLDFYPDSSSPSHVDFIEDISEENRRNKQNRFIQLSDGVTACVSHPLNGTIVAGTKSSSLLMVSQKHQSTNNSPESKNNEED